MLVLLLSTLETEEEKSKFKAIYYEYRMLMANRAFDILGDRGLTEDAVQNAFLKILKNIKCVGEVKSTKTKNFVVIITENCAKDIYRKERRTRLFKHMDYDESTDYLEDEIETKISVENVKRQIGELPEAYSDVLLLKYFNGLSDREIASALSLTVAAVRKRLYRGRQRLLALKGEDE